MILALWKRGCIPHIQLKHVLWVYSHFFSLYPRLSSDTSDLWLSFFSALQSWLGNCLQEDETVSSQSRPSRKPAWAVSLVRLRYRHQLTGKTEIQASARHLFKKVQFFRGKTCLLLGADSRFITSFWWRTWPGWSSCSICKPLLTFSSLPIQYLTHKTIWCSSFLPITFG